MNIVSMKPLRKFIDEIMLKELINNIFSNNHLTVSAYVSIHLVPAWNMRNH